VIATIEELLVSALQTAHAGTKVMVEPYPDSVDTYILKSEAAVLVHYLGAPYDSPQESPIVQQVMDPTFAVVTLSRNLRSHVGAYSLMDKNRAAIVGLQLSGLIFSGQKEEYITRESSVWWYQQVFSVPFLYNGVIAQ